VWVTKFFQGLFSSKPKDIQTKPLFEHDCNNCVFLGRYSEEGEDLADLYWCAQLGISMPTLIVRFSDAGPDYHSVQPAVIDEQSIAAMQAAKRRARMKGLPLK